MRLTSGWFNAYLFFTAKDDPRLTEAIAAMQGNVSEQGLCFNTPTGINQREMQNSQLLKHLGQLTALNQ